MRCNWSELMQRGDEQMEDPDTRRIDASDAGSCHCSIAGDGAGGCEYSDWCSQRCEGHVRDCGRPNAERLGRCECVEWIGWIENGFTFWRRGS